ncbi:MAG: hypothetical protein KDA42_05110 [Planctomycetales bacterium]|nr:hypothetical protein [Planctomycetales bacterium]
MELFSIDCTTCQAKLIVRDLSAIGQILACPKCASMVQIVPPANWTAQPATTEPIADTASASVPTTSDSDISRNTQPDFDPAAATATEPMAAGAADPIETPTAAWESPLESQTRRVVEIAFGSIAAVAIVVLVGIMGWNAFRAPDEPEVAVAETAKSASAAERSTDNSTEAAVDSTEENTPVPDLQPKVESQQDPANVDEQVQIPALPVEAVQPLNDNVENAAEQAPPADVVDPAPAAENTVPLASKGVADAQGTETADPKTLSPNSNPESATPDEVLSADEHVDNPLLVEEPAVRRFPNPGDENGSFQDQLVERIAFRVEQIELPGVKPRAFVELMIDMTALPIAFDLDALSPRQIAALPALEVKKQDVSIAELMSETLTKAGYTYLTEANGLIVTTRSSASNKLKRYRYPTDDLRGDGPDAPAQFAQLLRRLVAPHSWEATPDARIEIVDGELWIEQTSDVHAQLVAFCERLRLARGLPLKSRFSRDRFALMPASIEHASRLEPEITFTFIEPAALRQVVQHLETETGLAIYVDWPSLKAEGFTPRTEIACSIVAEPLGQALTSITRPLGLAWRMVDDRTIEIFGRERAESQLVVAFYDLREALREGVAPPTALAQIRQSVIEAGNLGATSRWSDDGGSGEIYFDMASRYAAVLQTHAAHAIIERCVVDLSSAGH